MINRNTYHWQCRDRFLKLGERTLVMGILNVTPDSFSDGGSYSDVNAAVDRALQMAAEGADIIDIGGESTRPGAASVSVEEELRRTIPVISGIRAQSNQFISIDTTKSDVAEQALDAGADIVNDVSAFEADQRMANVVARSRAGAVLMHMKGTPQTMQEKPSYLNVVDEVINYLSSRAVFCEKMGINRGQIVIDPGIGFGKTTEHNLELLRNLPEMHKCGRPVLVGASRKSFIGQLLKHENPEERIAGSLGVAAWSMLHGGHILRVHDVLDTCDVRHMLDTLYLR